MFYEIEYQPNSGIAIIKAKNFTYIFHLDSHFKNYKLVGKSIPKDFNFGNFKLITGKAGDLEIKSKIEREIPISTEELKLHLPAEKCCIYSNEMLVN